tara:strand:- start:2938 stop:3252 length:315 start_codon:yes stop_codon:yes gene_type:complete
MSTNNNQGSTNHDAERTVTMWSRFRAEADPGGWVIERSYPLRYLIDAMDMPANAGETKPQGGGREVAWFELGADPNKPAYKGEACCSTRSADGQLYTWHRDEDK